MASRGGDEAAREDPQTASVWALLLCGLAISFALIRLPAAMASERIDPSWLAFLGYAYGKGLQAGVDYIFTYGPLGAFYGNVFVPELYWQRYGWELGVRPLQAFALVFLLGRVVSQPMLVFATALLCWFFLLGIDAQAVWHLAVLASLLVLAGAVRIGPAVLLPMTALLAIASLVKFSFLYQAVIGMGFIVLAARDPNPLRRLRVVASFLVCFAVAWTLCGQRVGSLVPYLTSSFELAEAYSDAMTIPGSTTLLALACLALASSITLIVATGVRRGRAERSLGELLILLTSSFLAFKHGVVRQDAHLSSTFAVLMFTPFLLRRPRLATSRSGWLSALSLLVFGVALVGLALTNAEHRGGFQRLFELQAAARWRSLALPAAEETRLLAGWREQQRKLDLPKTRELIGDRSVDIFSYSQGLMLLNGFNLVTRPVFQSHMAFTQKLLSANAEFYASEAAPDFVLLSLQTVDGRLPTLEDSLALRVVRDRYEVVADAGSHLVLRRQTPVQASVDPPSEIEIRQLGRVAFGEWVACDPALNGQDWGLSLRIQRSLVGRLRSFLFRGVPVYLELDVGEPTPARYRLIPEMAEAPFLVSPSPGSASPTRLLLSERQISALRPRRFRVVADGSPAWFQHEIAYGVVDARAFRPLTIAAGAAAF